MPSFLADIHACMYRDGRPQTLNEDQEASKRAMYERLKPRQRKFVDKIGYENWDPFAKPNDPLDIRQDTTKRTTQQLVREFLQMASQNGSYSNEYGQGALQAALGIINRDENMRGTFDFCLWYYDLLRREGHIAPHALKPMPQSN